MHTSTTRLSRDFDELRFYRDEDDAHIGNDFAEAAFKFAQSCNQLMATYNILAASNQMDAAALVNAAHFECVRTQQVIMMALRRMSIAGQTAFRTRSAKLVAEEARLKAQQRPSG